MVAWDQDRGRRSGTSLLTSRKRSSGTLGALHALDRPHPACFPSEGPAPPNCLCGSISVLPPNTPHSAEELLCAVCSARWPRIARLCISAVPSCPARDRRLRCLTPYSRHCCRSCALSVHLKAV